MKLALVLATVIFPALAGPGVLEQQTKPSPGEGDTATLSVTAQLVALDVRVVNEQGKFVSGLDRNSFIVLEDQAEQRIVSVEGPHSHVMPASSVAVVSSSADLPRIGTAPVNVLIVDELNSTVQNISRTHQALTKFLESQSELLPVPTELLSVGQSQVTLLHDFTQSRSELLRSLSMHAPDVDPRAVSNMADGSSYGAHEGFSRTVGSLLQVASSLRGVPGHKNMVWVGAGFDAAYDLSSTSDADQAHIQQLLEAVTRRLLEARITLSTIDPAGVDPNVPTEDIADEATLNQGPNSLTDFAQHASFDELAEVTGGTVVHGRNDLGRLIRDDVNAAGDYYTIAYRPSSRWTGQVQYRRIQVLMNDPHLHASTRKGYFTGPESAVNSSEERKLQTTQQTFDILGALGSRLIYTGLHVGATVLPDGYSVSVEAKDLHWTVQDAYQLAHVDVVGAAFAGSGKALTQAADEFQERIAAAQQTNGKHVAVKFTMKVPANATRVRLIVRDADSGNVGSVDLIR